MNLHRYDSKFKILKNEVDATLENVRFSEIFVSYLKYYSR